MDKFSIHTVGNNFYLLVRVRVKPGTGLQGEIIKRDQIPEVGILRIVIVSKCKVKASNMPTVISEVDLPCRNLG